MSDKTKTQPIPQEDIDRIISSKECMMDAFKAVMWNAYRRGYIEGQRYYHKVNSNKG